MLEEIISPLFSTEWGRRSGLALLTLAGILLISTIIKAPFSWHTDFQLTRPITLVSTSPLHQIDPLAVLIEKIPQRHLLGNNETVISTLPITRLPFALIGIFQSTPKTLSHAIISEAGQTGKMYKIGDKVTSGITISDIKGDSVIVNNNGHLEKLSLQRLSLLFQPSQKTLLGK
jgi:type II secretory pathway component PulC